MLIELIRKQIRTCGKSRYQISKDTSVGQDILCKIMKGGNCKTETVDALLKYFNFEVVKKRKAGKGR